MSKEACPPIELRRVRLASKPSLRALLSDCLGEFAAMAGTEPELGLDGQPAYAYFDAYWEEQARTPLGVWLGDRLVGFCLLRDLGHAWQIAEFYVDPSARRRHVGAEAITLVTRFCVSSRRHSELRAKVAHWNDTGLAFWRSQGFHSRSTDTDGVLTVLVLHQRGDARIRPARADEAEVLLGIQRDAAVAGFGQIFPPDLYPFPDEPVRDGWVAALADPGVEVYVAEVDGAVVGSVAVEDEWLRTLYVVPSRWGAGTGTALHDYALERVRQTGVPDARLWTLEGNAAGRRFYERRGWVETGRTRAVPFPPYPLDVEYRRPLCDRLDAPDRSGNER